MGQINHPIVGRVSFTPLSGGRIRLPESFKSRIGTAFVPQLKGVPTYNGAFSGRVPFYKPAIPQLLAAFRVVERAGLLHRVIFWSGSWVPRMKRGSKTSPSEHTWGCAFDINHEQNGFRSTPAAEGEKGYLRDIAQIIKKFGFEWGGDWRSKDGMHFQVKRILNAAEIAALEGEMVAPLPSNVPHTIKLERFKEPAKLVIVRNGERKVVKSSVLVDGRFACGAVELLDMVGVKPSKQVNRLDEPQPRVELWFDEVADA